MNNQITTKEELLPSDESSSRVFPMRVNPSMDLSFVQDPTYSILRESELLEYLSQTVVVLNDETHTTFIFFFYDGYNFEHHVISDWELNSNNGTKQMQRLAALKRCNLSLIHI